jgi:thioredoxin-like negative regulator of GroEL
VQVVFLKVDVDENEETSAACGINCMPTFQLFKNGGKVGEIEGADEARLRALIDEKLGAAEAEAEAGGM